jgi:hypothetical protein
MKEVRRLSEKIAKLAEAPAPAPEGRVLATGADGTTLAAILREVDETVLPRRLIFRRGEGTLTLAAGNRRLISVDTAEGPGAGEAADILGVALTQPDVAMLGQLRVALTAGLPGHDPILVTIAPPTDDKVDFAAGTTAVALASAWGVDISDPEASETKPADPMDTFFGAAPSLASAWLRITSGEIADAGGDEALLDRLRDFAGSADLADLDMSPDGETSRFVAIGRAPDDGNCLLFVSEKLEAALFLLPSDALDAAKATWISARS